MAPSVVQLPTGKALTVRMAVDVFLDSLDNPNTVRNYGVRVDKTAERLGENRPLASVADEKLGEALEPLWGSAAVNTWNTHRAAVLSWVGGCRDHGYEGPAVPAWAKRLAVPDTETLVCSLLPYQRPSSALVTQPTPQPSPSRPPVAPARLCRTSSPGTPLTHLGEKPESTPEIISGCPVPIGSVRHRLRQRTRPYD